jgi:hypothetical protein
LSALRVFDDFLPNPESYRADALKSKFKSFDFPDFGVMFHGIARPTPADVPLMITERFPALEPTLSFFRRSPAGQTEPHFIHTDTDMGEWTALLYLNHAPPKWDGTAFWRYLPTGQIESAIPHERSEEGRRPDPDIWKPWHRVASRFNRLVMFPATYFHSRSIFENWTQDGDDRLTQVVFGKGEFPE